MKEKQAKLPGPDGPIAMECNPARVVIAVAGHVVADTRNDEATLFSCTCVPNRSSIITRED